jgi:hypothetical protein
VSVGIFRTGAVGETIAARLDALLFLGTRANRGPF